MGDSGAGPQMAEGQGAGHPQTVGKYRIERLLGEGAMGVVYRGHDPDIDRVVAIKTLHAHLIAREERGAWLDRFAREAKAAGRCMHPNLVMVFDYLELGGAPYLVMEYLEAGTLEARMAAPPPLPLEAVGSVMSQMLAGLGHIHAAGIVHRDVKPANLLLLPDGRLKIADFGVARVEALGATQGGMIGTPSYMSPEQFDARPADHRSDLFSAGVILYELLCGRKPFPSESLGRLAQAVLNGAFAPPTTVVPALPARFDEVMARVLAPDPAARYGSAAEFAAALVPAFAGLDSSVVPDGDRTVIAPAGFGRTGSSRSGTGAPALSGSLAERMPKALAERIERLLAERMGPMARIVLRKAASGTNDMARLVDTLAEQLAERDRAAFRAALLPHLSATGVEPRGVVLPPELLAEATRLLTPHVGPIARVLVKKAAETTRSREELLASLAGHIRDERARAGFLKTVA